MSFTEAKGFERASPMTKSVLLREAQSAQSKDVFLSHSTKDDDLVPGVIEFFRDSGASVYVDDFDARLPDPPSVETAIALKGEIRAIRRLVVLATPNTHTSRWIPWELGLGDGMRGIAPNAILPLTPEGEIPAWINTEYFRLYPLIIRLNEDWVVTDPRDGRAWTLKQWLTSASF